MQINTGKKKITLKKVSFFASAKCGTAGKPANLIAVLVVIRAIRLVLYAAASRKKQLCLFVVTSARVIPILVFFIVTKGKGKTIILLLNQYKFIIME